MLPSNDPNRGSTSRAARIWPRYSRTRLTFSKMQPDWQCAVAWTRPLPHKSQCFRDFQTQTARSEEHTSELQSLMRISYAVFCLKKKKHTSTKYQNSIKHRPNDVHSDNKQK